MSTYLFSLEPEGIFAGADRGGDQGFSGGGVLFHSDTLLGALRSVAEESAPGAAMGSERAENLSVAARGDAAAAWTVSSVFFEVGGTRLYPRPLRPPAIFLEAANDVAGDLPAAPPPDWDSIELLTEGRLESICEGRRVRWDPLDFVRGKVWCMPSERGLGELPRWETSARLEVDRSGGGVQRFERRRCVLPPGARLFFLARLEDPAHLASLKRLVELLGESGLGGGRSSGAGHFRLAGAYPAPGFLKEAASAGDAKVGNDSESPPAASLLLSLYLPSREEWERGVLARARTRLLRRGGYIHSGGATRARKLAVNMAAEGTLLPRDRGAITGEVRDVTPPGFDRHPVYRDGRAFLVPCRGISAEEG